MRRIVIGRLDGSSLPAELTHTKVQQATQVIGNLNDVIPDVNEKWELPTNIERLAPTQTRSANWLETETVRELDSFLESEIENETDKVEELRELVNESVSLRLMKEEELEVLYAELELSSKLSQGGVQND